MKKLTLILCLLLANSICAQNQHLTFKGVPIDGTLKDYTEAMKKAGFKYEGSQDGVSILSGDFAGFKQCLIGVSTLSNCDVVSRIAVIFPSRNTWSSLVGDYEQLKAMLSKKYGNPEESSEKFTAYVGNDNGLKMHALRDDECEWYTIYSTELGDIELSLVEGTSYLTGAVRLVYYDKINSDKVKNAAIDDL